MSTQHQFDGYPVDFVEPGQASVYRYPNLNIGATLWYHDHALHMASTHVYRGLSAFYILKDEVEDQLPLPKTYGVDDIPLLIADKLFGPNGQLIYEVQGNQGVVGNVVLVNGAPFPRFEVANRKYRFRILNGSDLLAYQLRLNTGQPFTMIGTDTGLMPEPQRVQTFRLGAAERYEFIIDFSEYPIGTQIVLQNLWDDIGEPSPVMRFDVVRQEDDPTEVPAVLRPDVRRVINQELIPANAVRTRKFEFGRRGGIWAINGLGWDTQRVDATPSNGDIEIWELYNKAGGWWHPIHIHLLIDGFKILDRNGKPPFPYERGLKDVAFVGENEHVRVIGRWAPFNGRFVFHCHNNYHEDHDMMSQFEVIGR
jgi:FtsP/CotA-like multicopper oxidase with cupredoxin domain